MGDFLPVVDLGNNRTVSTTVANPIATSLQGTCVVLENGDVKCWGFGIDCELGDNSFTRGYTAGTMGENMPKVDIGAHTAAQLVAGNTFFCVRREDGVVKCWGDNTYGQIGWTNAVDTNPVGCNPAVDMGTNKTVISLGATATNIAVGHGHVCALLSTGSVKCWGDNTDGATGALAGQLGINTSSAEPGPARARHGRDHRRHRPCARRRQLPHLCHHDGEPRPLLRQERGRPARDATSSTRPSATSPATWRRWWTPAWERAGWRRSSRVPTIRARSSARPRRAPGRPGYNGDGGLGLGDTNNRGDGPSESGNLLPTLALGTGRTAKWLGWALTSPARCSTTTRSSAGVNAGRARLRRFDHANQRRRPRPSTSARA